MGAATKRDSGLTHDCTDLRNAERLVELHGERLRYVHAWKKPLVWSGCRWSVDDTGAALRLAAGTARRMLSVATEELHVAQQAFADAKAGGDEQRATEAEGEIARAKARWGHAIKTQQSSKLHAMLELAFADAAVAVRHEELDADPLLLNVENGTIDLRTGALRPHEPSDLITKLIPIAYEPNAMCPTWDAFLNAAQSGNDDMLTFLRRSRGYMLTGLTREHVLFFMFGPTGTGKSTYFVTLHALLGEYGARAPRGLLIKSNGEKHETGLTTLFGARFVSCSEVDEGAVIDEALVKDLTGGESISARRMREDNWTFAPTHKLAIPGNHKPVVRNFDDAIRRRLRLVPFVVQPTAPDSGLVDKLRAELPGILADAVRGCLEWQEHGLGEPIAVRDATDAFQDESDVLGEFFRLYVTFEPDAACPRKMLRIAYETYAGENGITPVGAKRFAAKLRANGVGDTSVRLPSGKVADGWRGVRLMTDPERVAAAAWSERRAVGSSRDQFPVRAPRENLSFPTNPGSTTTDPYRPTDDDDADERTAIQHEAGE
jgi:putative DNA primase/helicase